MKVFLSLFAIFLFSWPASSPASDKCSFWLAMLSPEFNDVYRELNRGSLDAAKINKMLENNPSILVQDMLAMLATSNNPKASLFLDKLVDLGVSSPNEKIRSATIQAIFLGVDRTEWGKVIDDGNVSNQERDKKFLLTAVHAFLSDKEDKVREDFRFFFSPLSGLNWKWSSRRGLIVWEAFSEESKGDSESSKRALNFINKNHRDFEIQQQKSQ